MEHQYVSDIFSDIVAISREYKYWNYGEIDCDREPTSSSNNTNKMLWMLLVDAGSLNMKYPISQQMKSMKRKHCKADTTA